MVDWGLVKEMAIPEGDVASVSCNGQLLWKKVVQKYKTRVNYIESTGTQYIDTGINKPMFGANDKILVGFQPMNVSGAAHLFGVMVGSRGCAIRTRNASWLQASLWQGGGPATNNVDTIYKKFDIELSKSGGYVLDGVQQAACGSGGPTLTALAYFPLCVGAYISATGSGSTEYTITPTKGKYYHLQYEVNGELKRDMIPVLDWSDRPCMYDKITDELYYNQGTGEFLWG